MSNCYESRDVDSNGKTYRVEFHFDHDSGAPWKEYDGRGVVSEWETRDKKPGEVIISSDHGFKRFYNVAATIAIAKRDGWGVSGINTRGMSKAKTAAVAVQHDLKRMRDWCSGAWHWCGIVVFPLTDAGDELRSKNESVWCIESDDEDSINEIIEDLILRIEQ